MSSAHGLSPDPAPRPPASVAERPACERIETIVPTITTLADRVEALARRTEAGDLGAGLLAPELLALIAGAMRDLGASALAVEALTRFADIGRDNGLTADAALPPVRREPASEARQPDPVPAPDAGASAPATPRLPTPPAIAAAATGSEPVDPMVLHARTAAEITYLAMTGLSAEQAAQRIARRFILGNRDDMIPAVGDDPRGFRRLLHWRQQMMAGRYGEAIHAAYAAHLATLKATGLPRHD